MRTIIKLLIATFAITLAPQAASAQNLDGILRAVTGTTNSLNRNCGSGAYALSCQLNRVTNVTNQMQNIQRQRENRRRQEMNVLRQQMNSEQRIAQSLQAACRAGDQESCSRYSVSSENSKMVNAIMQACSAGDQRSCERVYALRDAR